MLKIQSRCLLIIVCFLAACASKEELAERQAELEAMSDWELCQNVAITVWPPHFNERRPLFRRIGEGRYIEELKKRDVKPILCSFASKACVGYGMTFGTEEHLKCSIEEGRASSRNTVIYNTTNNPPQPQYLPPIQQMPTPPMPKLSPPLNQTLGW